MALDIDWPGERERDDMTGGRTTISQVSVSMRSRVARLLLAAAAATLLPSPANADEIAQGRELAERLCAKCHLLQGQSDKGTATEVPGFAAVARRPGQSVEGVVAWLRSTPKSMPNHHLNQDEMFSLAGYILSLREAR